MSGLPVPDDYEVDWPDELYDREPDVTVYTGIDDGSGARTLAVYWWDGKTYVSPNGESQNAAPWRFATLVEPAIVRLEYLTEVSEKDT